MRGKGCGGCCFGWVCYRWEWMLLLLLLLMMIVWGLSTDENSCFETAVWQMNSSGKVINLKPARNIGWMARDVVGAVLDGYATVGNACCCCCCCCCWWCEGYQQIRVVILRQLCDKWNGDLLFFIILSSVSNSCFLVAVWIIHAFSLLVHENCLHWGLHTV